jgi:hypothetical protein
MIYHRQKMIDGHKKDDLPMERHEQNRPLKDQVVAFKADAQLAALLSGVKNKSELIRDAVYAFLGHLCPLCNGKGTIDANRGHEIELLLKQLEFASCSGCHTPLPVIPKLREIVRQLPQADRERLGEYEKTGELLCVSCYESADQCEDCGQHVPQGSLRRHQHARHSPATDIAEKKRRT